MIQVEDVVLWSAITADTILKSEAGKLKRNAVELIVSRVFELLIM